MHQSFYKRVWSEVWQAKMHVEERLTIFVERLKLVVSVVRVIETTG
jgi:hypothetical protein